MTGRKGNLHLAEGRLGSVAVLSREVTGLARLRLVGVAKRDLSTLVGVKVGACGGAVAVLWNGLLMDVVHFLC